MNVFPDNIKLLSTPRFLEVGVAKGALETLIWPFMLTMKRVPY
tara:strand:+ start:673 stop:801 length:129 start_codon:yes stop_codon:yes gene_type:complete